MLSNMLYQYPKAKACFRESCTISLDPQVVEGCWRWVLVSCRLASIVPPVFFWGMNDWVQLSCFRLLSEYLSDQDSGPELIETTIHPWSVCLGNQLSALMISSGQVFFPLMSWARGEGIRSKRGLATKLYGHWSVHFFRRFSKACQRKGKKKMKLDPRIPMRLLFLQTPMLPHRAVIPS